MLHLLLIFAALQKTDSSNSGTETFSAANYNVGAPLSHASETTQVTTEFDLEKLAETGQCNKGT